MNRSYNTVTSSDYIDENIIKDVVEKYKNTAYDYEYHGLCNMKNLTTYHSNTSYKFSFICPYDLDCIDITMDLSIQFPELFFKYYYCNNDCSNRYVLFIVNGKIIFSTD